MMRPPEETSVLMDDEDIFSELDAGEKKWYQKIPRRLPTKKEVVDGTKRVAKWVAFPNGKPPWYDFKNNLKAGITVSMVSVPLSISLAIAGGGTPANGIVTAFWAGIVAAFVGGSHFNIVGPTGALSGVLQASANAHGAQMLPVLAIVAGILCFLVFAFGIDRYVMFIPSSVIHGFTVGVAVIIGGGQLNSALGLTLPPGLKPETFLDGMWYSLKEISTINPVATVWFLLNLIALLALIHKWPKVPWAIVMTVLGIAAGALVTYKVVPLSLPTLQSKYGDITLNLVAFPSIDRQVVNFQTLTTAVGVAFIAILETLISARIADGMTKTEHNQKREVFGVAVANIACGIFGGLPATAALARTALNVKSGATSRVSAIINCIAVLVISLAAFPAFKFIPMSTIAAILVMIAIRMVAAEHLVHMFKFDRTMFWISLISAFFCVVIDTMAGILVGAVISLLIFIDQMSVGHTEILLNKGNRCLSELDLTSFDKCEEHPHPEPNHQGGFFSPKQTRKHNADNQAVELSTQKNAGVPQTEEFEDNLVYRITGQLTFVNAIAHSHRIKRLAEDSNLKGVVLSLKYLWYVDLDGVDALQDMVSTLEQHKIKVVFACVNQGNVAAVLSKHEFYQAKLRDGCVFAGYEAAISSLGRE